MDILDPCCDVLSNREVYEFLKTNPIGDTKKITNLATITYETTTYLESTPAATTTIDSIKIFEKACKERNYKLTKVETVQLINLFPQNETEFNLILDNFEERFDDKQKDDLIDLVKAMKVRNMPDSSSDDSMPRKKVKTS